MSDPQPDPAENGQQTARSPGVTCACCGVVFPKPRRSKRFCSSACRSAAGRADRDREIETLLTDLQRRIERLQPRRRKAEAHPTG
jgi:hypothetical protein